MFHKVSRHLVNLTMPMLLPFRVFGWAVCDNVHWQGLYILGAVFSCTCTPT